MVYASSPDAHPALQARICACSPLRVASMRGSASLCRIVHAEASRKKPVTLMRMVSKSSPYSCGCTCR